MAWNESNSFRYADLTDEQKSDRRYRTLGFGLSSDTHLWKYREVSGAPQRTCVFYRNPDKSKTWIWPGGVE